MDRHDRGLRVVRPRQHDLQLELVEVLRQAGDAVGDLGVDASVVGLLGELEEHREVVGIRGQFFEARDGARELGPLADDLLSPPVVLPEGRLGHLGVEGGEALFLGRDVKDDLGARSAGSPRA